MHRVGGASQIGEPVEQGNLTGRHVPLTWLRSQISHGSISTLLSAAKSRTRPPATHTRARGVGRSEFRTPSDRRTDARAPRSLTQPP